jgi:hypothetical protein
MTVRERAEKFLERAKCCGCAPVSSKRRGSDCFGGGHEGDLGGSDSCPEDF